MKPRLLDLFCKAGGTTKGYQRAGFYVVGVDIEPQPNYCGDEFHQADAFEFPLEGFDVIHASPPCQAYSVATRDRSGHPDLVLKVRQRINPRWCEWLYIIENVPGAPLIHPVKLCGSSFGLPLHRHRLFESNINLMVPPCAHGQLARKFDVYEHGRWYKGATVKVYGSGGGKANEHWAEAMGIDWMTPAELVEAIPPAFTELIGHQLAQQLQKAAA